VPNNQIVVKYSSRSAFIFFLRILLLILIQTIPPPEELLFTHHIRRKVISAVTFNIARYWAEVAPGDLLKAPFEVNVIVQVFYVLVTSIF
jgi:hypothetical protein